ncbi:hypothetical protein EV121DRAFT_277267 [Schizophyllum commune]
MALNSQKLWEEDWTQLRLDSDGPDDKLIKNKHRQGKRASDGAFVVIKFVLWRKYRTEADVVRRLLSGNLHLPKLDRFQYLDVIDVSLEEEGGASLVISEVCAEEDAWWDLANPRDILRGVYQLAECVHFLHTKRIAHCDIWSPNVVVRLPLDRPLRWALIDFNSAVVEEQGTPPPIITPLHHTGSRLEAPEFYAPFWTQIDPFAYDVFCLGHLMEIVMEVYFLSLNLRRYLLIMIDQEPSLRPSSASVIERLTAEIEALDQGEDPKDAVPEVLVDLQSARAEFDVTPHSLLTYLHEKEKHHRAVNISADEASPSISISAIEAAAALISVL